MSVLVITTGGTIGAVAHDKLKNPDRIQIMPPEGVDPVRDLLQGDLSNGLTRFVTFEHRDSNHIDDPYRERLSKLVEGEPENAVLITHGTDALMQTVNYFFQRQHDNLNLKNKVILFTGSMVPLSCGAQSEGYLNLKFSLEQLSSKNLKPGIYIVLCDYVDAEKRTGWTPRLYPYAPGRYQKYYDPEDGSRSRILAIAQ